MLLTSSVQFQISKHAQEHKTNTDDDPDKQFSLQVLDRKQHNVDQVEELPCDKDTQNPVTRWDKECRDLSNTDTIDLYQNWNWRDFQNYQKPLESYWRLALRINKWGINRRPAKQQINEDDTKQNDAGGETEQPEKADEHLGEPAAQADNTGVLPVQLGPALQASFQLPQTWEDTDGFTRDEAYALTTDKGAPLTYEILETIKNEQNKPQRKKIRQGTGLIDQFVKCNGQTVSKMQWPTSSKRKKNRCSSSCV